MKRPAMKAKSDKLGSMEGMWTEWFVVVPAIVVGLLAAGFILVTAVGASFRRRDR